MDMIGIIGCLKEDFGISDSSYLILRALSSNERLTANQISNKTEIPVSKIYHPINELISQKFLLKTYSRPTLYYLNDLNDSVIVFLRNKFNEYVSKESELSSCIEEKYRNLAGKISDAYDYVFNTRKILNKGNSFKIITMDGVFPTLFYTPNIKNFIKIRSNEIKNRKTLMGCGDLVKEFHNSFWENYGKKRFSYIISRNTWQLYKMHILSLFKKDELAKIILSVKDSLKKFNISVRVTESNSPYCMFITENIMMFTIFNIYTSGLMMNDKKIAEIYSKLFEDMWGDSKPIEPLLDEILHGAFRK
jgi:hypothetical protein